MSSLIIREATERGELDTIVEVMWKAYHEPYRPDFQAFHPVFGATAADREAAIRTDKQRAWEGHVNNTSSHWLYVVDASNNEVVGGTQWLIYKENPFPEAPRRLECTWYPEGEGRNFVTEMINQLYTPRHTWMNRPFLALNRLGVNPTHRRRGVASLLMTWGVKVAQELNLESFIEASESGRLLYEKFGYRALMKIAVSAAKSNPSDEWKKLSHELCPSDFYAMWRPAGGQFKEDESRAMWEFTQCHNASDRT